MIVAVVEDVPLALQFRRNTICYGGISSAILSLIHRAYCSCHCRRSLSESCGARGNDRMGHGGYLTTDRYTFNPL